MPRTTIGFGSGATHSYYQGGPWANLYSGSGTGPLAYTGGGLENPITPGPSKQAPSQNLGYSGIGTGLGNNPQAQPTQAQTPSWWNPLANTPSGFYQPANQPHTQEYYNFLKSGWSVNPNTGAALSPAQVAGKMGGAAGAGLRGIHDPVAAQAAIQQFQQSLASGGLVPSGGLYKTPAELSGGPSGGYYSMGIDPATGTNMMRQNWQSLNPAANFNPSSTDLQGLLGQFLTNAPGNPNAAGYQSSLGALESGIQNYVKAQEAAKINAAAAAAPPSTPQQVYQSQQPGFSGIYTGDPAKAIPQSALDYGKSQMEQGNVWNPRLNQWVQGVWNPFLKNYDLPKGTGLDYKP